jgi:hypothetical protein
MVLRTLAGNLRPARVREAPESLDRAVVDDVRSEALGVHHLAGRGRVFRLRDLDRRGRLGALVFAAALLIAPLLAFAWAVPDWAPAGDTAIMGLRALDVGTSRTPLIGQPSSSELYERGDGPAHHPGPTHFYLLAGPVRLLGGGIGMPLVSVLIVGACVLLAAWAVFRQLGPPAGVLAGVVLGGVMFTTGASSLIDPVSSRVAGYPLLCSSVLLWCVLCGDLRLLPLTTGVVSFTAQQHLSVEPAIVVLTAGAGAGLVVWVVRHHGWRDPQVRRQLARASGWSALVALVMWAPVLLDQVSDTGNLGRVASYATRNDHDTLGATSAVHQIVHALGLPPLLGQTEFSGQWLLDSPSIFTWLTAVAVAAAVAALGVRWWRASRRRTGLAIMVGLAVLAGLANGSSVPVGFEQARPAFYHWSFVLAFFTALVLGLGALDLARRATTTTRASFAPALASVALLAILVPSALNPTLDRTTNTLDGTQAFWKGRHFDQLTDAILAHRHDLGTQTLLLGGGRGVFSKYREALAFDLADRGLDVRLPRYQRGFVNEDRLVDKSTVHSGLILQEIGRKRLAKPPPGELVGEINLNPDSGFNATNPYLIVGLRVSFVGRDELLKVARPNEL